MNMPTVFVYIYSFYLVFGFEEWFVVWLGLELNMISFLMLGHMMNNIMVIEAMVKYFFIQSLASGVIMGMMYFGWNFVVWSMVLTMKMGLGPFFGWYIKVVKSFTWWVNYILMVFQKIILLTLVLEIVSMFVFYVGLLSLFVGVVGVFGQVNMKSLMGYSSVFHGGWMFMLMEEKSVIWWLYFVFYALMMLGVISFLSSQLFLSIYVSIGLSKGGFILMMLNLAGIPPFTGFIMKWLSFYFLWMFDYWLLVLMVLMSVVMLYAYFRFVYDIFMGSVFISGWKVYNSLFFVMESLGLAGLLFIFLL
uniref:NADH-ubiquinone oxidoreductase chain 2 n=1 Tax=Parachtes romandiolae TaxID=1110492 RepID=A0A516IMA5_9ARAC|nr:NADH dehydrogenase subunit 2 [Parachtes romandiolae]QDP17904.1 NADH dehydrogenase subunit 2 [Parachtes romandiolae]